MLYDEIELDSADENPQSGSRGFRGKREPGLSEMEVPDEFRGCSKSCLLLRFWHDPLRMNA